MTDDRDAPPSVRLLGNTLATPQTGMPTYIRHHLDPYVTHGLNAIKPEHLTLLALRLGLSWDPYKSPRLGVSAGESLVQATTQDVAKYLDLIELLLGAHKRAVNEDGADETLPTAIDTILAVGGSAYAVSPDGTRLVFRNDPTVAAAAEAAVSVDDDAAQEIAIAYNYAFGREPNGQNAWAAAIRAVESALIPILWPDPSRRGKQTISSARNRLRDEPAKWRVNHPTITLDALVAMLSALAYEPRRHGGDERPEATVRDGAAAVHLAVTLVSWLRAGIFAAAD